MAGSVGTLKEIRDNIASTVLDTQISNLIDAYINITLGEIHNFHPWSWLRQKQTFSTVASQESYNLDDEIDRIAILRQITTPRKLIYLPDEILYRIVPDPENQVTGNPLYYRLWNETGFSTNLAAADTIYIKSDSASDTSAFKVVIVGRDANGTVLSETISCNGTNAVTSANTYAADGLLQCSKSATTTGTITVYRTTGNTVLSRLSPEDRQAMYKRISLFPIPSDAITMYIEYYTKFRQLVSDNDVPQVNSKWTWVIREGTLAKLWIYKRNETLSTLAQAQFMRGLQAMRQDDTANLDYIPVIARRGIWRNTDLIQMNDTGGYALVH